MQVLIFIVLLFIACVLAPWLLGLLTALFAGAAAVVLGVGGLLLVVGLCWALYQQFGPTPEQRLQRRADRVARRAAKRNN